MLIILTKTKSVYNYNLMDRVTLSSMAPFVELEEHFILVLCLAYITYILYSWGPVTIILLFVSFHFQNSPAFLIVYFRIKMPIRAITKFKY